MLNTRACSNTSDRCPSVCRYRRRKWMCHGAIAFTGRAKTTWRRPFRADCDAMDRSRTFCRLAARLTTYLTRQQFVPRLSCSIAVLAITSCTYFLHLPQSSVILIDSESCPRLDVVHPGRAWSSSPTCTWHCSLHYLFLQPTPLFPHCVTIVC